jgi:molybdopterin converting factor small subunit
MHDPDTETLQIALFAGMAEIVGARTIVVPWRGGTVEDLRRTLAAAHPGVAGLLARSAVARGVGYVADEERIVSGDDVAIIPPVSGG